MKVVVSIVVALGLCVTACGKKDPDGPPDASADSAPPPPSPVEGWAKASTHADVVVHTLHVQNSKTMEFVVDIADTVSGLSLAGQPVDGLAVTIDGRYVPGTFVVKTVREAGESLGVALLLYNAPAPEEDARAALLRAQVERGAKDFLLRLGAQDRIAVFVYDAESLTVVAPWGSTPSLAAERLATALAPREPSSKVPSLFRALKKVAESFLEDDTNQPKVRALVVVSDGVDMMHDKPAVLVKRLDEIVDLTQASPSPVSVDTLDVALDPAQPDVLSTVAAKTKGRYRRVAGDDMEQVGGQIAAEADRLAQRYMIRFVSDAPFGSNAPVTLELAVKTKSGAFGRTKVDGVKMPILRSSR